MAICCAVGCSNRSDSGDKISFHRFPKNPQLRKAWIVALRRKNWTPYHTSVLCIKHFEEKYCTRLLNKTILTEDAIPTIFPTHKAICKIKKVACPANVPVNISVEEPCDKLTDPEESIYAIGFKMTENILDSAEHFPTEHAENTVRNIEETENAEKSTTKLPSIVYTLTSSGPEESIELLKDKLNTVKTENKKYMKELRKLQQKSRRLNKNIAKMETFIYGYKENNWISDASLEILKTLPALDNELLALHLSFQQSHFPAECLTDSNPCDELSSTNNEEGTIYISD